MARTYTKSKRAEQEAETRQRIVEATVDLHAEIGPARTTISMVAERAGVQRHTVYAHFPDDRSLVHGLLGLTRWHAIPCPSPEEWSGVNDPGVRLERALTALYAWYARNARLMASVLRDAEIDALTREVTELRAGACDAGHQGVRCPPGSAAKGEAALTLAMSFHTWRTLVVDARARSVRRCRPDGPRGYRNDGPRQAEGAALRRPLSELGCGR